MCRDSPVRFNKISGNYGSKVPFLQSYVEIISSTKESFKRQLDLLSSLGHFFHANSSWQPIVVILRDT
jgi:hypothetical protein